MVNKEYYMENIECFKKNYGPGFRTLLNILASHSCTASRNEQLLQSDFYSPSGVGGLQKEQHEIHKLFREYNRH